MDFFNRDIIPHFQPIIAIDRNEVYSYEVLGRYIENDGTVKSLGSFFIEITEDEFNDESGAFVKAIEFYKSMGCRIAIDDYGTGASNY